MLYNFKEKCMSSEQLEEKEMYSEVPNKSVRATLQHQLERPLEHIVKQFIDSDLINPKKSKDVEDVIRAYWSVQDVTSQNFRINTMQQRMDVLFDKNPGLIKKLHTCRSMFNEQQTKHTNYMKGILKFGTNCFFTTEYASNVIHPMVGEGVVWGQTSGVADKQLCIVVAGMAAKWIKGVHNPDDVQYINFLQKLFMNFTTSSEITMATSKSPSIIEKSPTFKGSAYTSRISAGSAETDGPSKEAYDVIYGNPFSAVDEIVRPAGNNMDPFGYRRRNKKQDNASVDDEVHAGIVSKYGLIECRSFDEQHYFSILDTYLKSPKFREENQSLYDFVWARFAIPYQQLVRGCVSRAIMATHQCMVDYLISVYEKKFSIPQLMMFYAPGTMIKVKTKYDINQCAMVLNSSVDNNGGLALKVDVLNPNTIKEANIMYHDVNNNGLTKSKPMYSVNITQAGTRSGSIFNYFTPSASISIMEDADIDTQLELSRSCLKMSIQPKHMFIDSNYYFSDRDWISDPEIRQEPYKGRVVVDFIKSRSGFTDFSADAVKTTTTFTDVYNKATPEHYKEHIVYPGGLDGNGSVILINGDMLLSDVRLMLSLPVVASAYILSAKRWGLVKLNDLSPVEYHPEAYDQLVMNDNIKEMIKIVTENQSKNTFRDIIGGKESGCIYLLAGDPGTGKSLTSEAIAEKLQKPLYKVSAGELGAKTWEIETTLKNICECAERWDAIILMDEADTFLSTRDAVSIERNAMIAMFLKQLEYFNGTLFLTTNMLDNIDPAIRSRILQTIKFVDLSAKERASIWDNLLKIQGVSLTGKQLENLGKYDINGRLIKNIIKVAIAMSLHANKPLDYDIIKTTAESMHGGQILTNKGFQNK